MHFYKHMLVVLWILKEMKWYWTWFFFVSIYNDCSLIICTITEDLNFVSCFTSSFHFQRIISCSIEMVIPKAVQTKRIPKWNMCQSSYVLFLTFNSDRSMHKAYSILWVIFISVYFLILTGYYFSIMQPFLS